MVFLSYSRFVYRWFFYVVLGFVAIIHIVGYPWLLPSFRAAAPLIIGAFILISLPMIITGLRGKPIWLSKKFFLDESRETILLVGRTLFSKKTADAIRYEKQTLRIIHEYPLTILKGWVEPQHFVRPFGKQLKVFAENRYLFSILENHHYFEFLTQRIP